MCPFFELSILREQVCVILSRYVSNVNVQRLLKRLKYETLYHYMIVCCMGDSLRGSSASPIPVGLRHAPGRRPGAVAQQIAK